MFCHCSYNERTATWFAKRAFFDTQSFYQNTSRLEHMEVRNGDLYPVSDACQRKGDPRDRCLYTASSFFATRLSVSENRVAVQVTDGDRIVFVEEDVPSLHYQRIDKSSLQCLKPMDWSDVSAVCSVTTYLSSICYRLQWSGTLFQLDTTPSVSTANVGCFQSNRWSPFVYGEQPRSEIPLEVVLLFHLNCRSDTTWTPQSPPPC